MTSTICIRTYPLAQDVAAGCPVCPRRFLLPDRFSVDVLNGNTVSVNYELADNFGTLLVRVMEVYAGE
jgi:hypothetical protein